jgi:[amino group carrier protein]-lysine/ornithine hydrolase
MLGHIDTVPGMIDVKIQDGILYGRGSVDAKGPFCAFISAASKAALNSRVILVGAVEEECPTSKGARHIIGKYDPDYIIIGEPSGSDAITLGYKGRLLYDFKLKQSLTHTSSASFGVTDKALEHYLAIRKHIAGFNSGKNDIFDQVQMNISSINSANDGFFESVSMTVGFRLPVGLNIDVLKQKIIDSWSMVRIYLSMVKRMQ